MRAVVQRVTRASVTVEGQVVGGIAAGLCVLVGVGREDTDRDASALAEKVARLRIFEDSEGKMNRSVLDHGGAILAISQFTLFGDARRGNRPSFTSAMQPQRAQELFDGFCDACRSTGVRVETGTFRAHMNVELVNDGPVTVLLDTERCF
jgi:D-aminoacyl-tRNA deacylase